MSCEEALLQPKPAPAGLPILLVAAAALLDADGRVLIAQRPADKTMPGLWEFPGGKVEAGESPEYALMRELEEELGIQTRPSCYWPVGCASHAYEKFHLLMPLFACRFWKGEIVATEHQALKWIPPKQLYNYAMPPADMPLIPQLINNL